MALYTCENPRYKSKMAPYGGPTSVYLRKNPASDCKLTKMLNNIAFSLFSIPNQC
jgi:hypothetical protein